MKAWHFRVAYTALAAGIGFFEWRAIKNEYKGDTITENVRLVIFFHPVLWYSFLGLYFGFGVWMTRHFWWRRK